MNAEQQHERLPIEIFTLIRKISVIKDLDYSKYPQQHPRDDGPEIIKTETGLKFVLKENLDFNASFDFDDIATCDEMIKNGKAALIDVPEVHMPRFLFLVALRSRILSYKQSLALLNRTFYYMNKAKEYEFLLLLVNLMILACFTQGGKRASVTLSSSDLGKELMARSIDQTRLFLESCPFMFSQEKDKVKNETFLKSSSFRYTHSNFFHNQLFVSGMILEYLAFLRIAMLSASDTANWIMNEVHHLKFIINFSSFGIPLQNLYPKKMENISGNSGISLSLSHNLCDQIMMMLFKNGDHEIASRFLKCAKSVYNLEIAGHDQKYLFNKNLHESGQNPQKIMEAFHILQNPKLVHYDMVIRDLIKSTRTSDVDDGYAHDDQKKTKWNNKKKGVLIQNQNNQKYAMEQISNLLVQLRKHQDGVHPKILFTIMNFFKFQKQYKTVVNIFETWTNLWSLPSQITPQSFDIKGLTVALESYFALQDVTKALNVFSKIEKHNQVDGHVLYIMMKNLIKCEFSELALKIYDNYTNPASGTLSIRKIPLQVYELLMSTFASKSDLGAASAIWTKMVDSGYQPTSKHFSIFIRGYGSIMGDMVKAKDVFASAFRAGIKPDSYMYNALIHGYIRNNRLEKALELYNEMKSKAVQPDKATEANLIKIYSLIGMEEEMLSAFERYKNLSNNKSFSFPFTANQINPAQSSGFAINPIIKYYAKRDQYSKMFEYISLLEKIPKTDEGFLEEFKDSLFPDTKSLKLTDKNNELIDSMVDLEPNVNVKEPNVNVKEPLFSSPPSLLLDREIAHDIVLRSLYEHKVNNNMIDAYVKLLMEKEHSSSVNFPLLCDSYMHHLIRNKQFQKLRIFFFNKVLKKCNHATQRLYLTFVKGMYRQGDQEECNRWLKVILDMGFTPGSRYFELANKVAVMRYRISPQGAVSKRKKQ